MKCSILSSCNSTPPYLLFTPHIQSQTTPSVADLHSRSHRHVKSYHHCLVLMSLSKRLNSIINIFQFLQSSDFSNYRIWNKKINSLHLPLTKGFLQHLPPLTILTTITNSHNHTTIAVITSTPYRKIVTLPSFSPF